MIDAIISVKENNNNNNVNINKIKTMLSKNDCAIDFVNKTIQKRTNHQESNGYWWAE